MRQVTLIQPEKLVFGEDCIMQFVNDFNALKHKSVIVVIAKPIRILLSNVLDRIKESGIKITVCEDIQKEPTISAVENILSDISNLKIDSVVGIGGGSVLDVAKILAVKINNPQTISEMVGIGRLNGRSTYLACIPTTSGTGSEVSPNAILLDENDNMKKGIISPFLVPDAVYIDPALTLGLPPNLTAETGLDALCHCIEAYTNKFSHPIIDLYALEGIRLISNSLLNAVKNGSNLEDRTNLSLGSYYGGLCLGPVNTAAVHALSYPLGGEFHVSHGLANAILLPAVFEFNSKANLHKHAQIAAVFGVDSSLTEPEMVECGILKLKELINSCGIPDKLSEIGIEISMIDKLAKMAMGVERLLKNNPRELTFNDAKDIYKKLF